MACSVADYVCNRYVQFLFLIEKVYKRCEDSYMVDITERLMKKIQCGLVSLKYLHLIIAAKVFKYFSIKNNKIVFSSFHGQYSAHPKEVFLKLQEMKDDNFFDMVWICQKESKAIENARKVRPYSIKSIYELMTAKVWIDNNRKEHWIKKRKGQLYIQTWHGPICIKMVEKDAEDQLSPFYIAGAKNDSHNIDYFVAESEWRKKNIKNSFWYDGKFIEGSFCVSEAKTNKNTVREFYKLDKSTRIILYAPTFRKDGRTDCYDINYSYVLNQLKLQTEKEYVFIVRLHPNLTAKEKMIAYSQNVLNGTQYPSVNELIQQADVVISDFSGVLFEGYRNKKFVVQYASDIDEYIKNERDVYFDFYQLPSPVATTNEELIEAIVHTDQCEYENKRAQFVETIGYYTESAVEQIVDIIMDTMK